MRLSPPQTIEITANGKFVLMIHACRLPRAFARALLRGFAAYQLFSEWKDTSTRLKTSFCAAAEAKGEKRRRLTRLAQFQQFLFQLR